MASRRADAVLAGLRVVDLCNDRAGSVAGMLLADLGADVVRIESSTGEHRRPEPSQSPDAVCWDRRKRTQVVERLDPHRDSALSELLAGADVALVDGGPRTVSGTALDPHTLSERHPALVVVWLPPYGDRGRAYADLPADPLLLSAVSAYAMFQPAVDPDVPIAPVVPVVENVHGALGAAASLAGVLERLRSGVGQVVALSGLDSASVLLASLVNEGLDVEQVIRPSRDAFGGPNFRPYVCGDGQWLFLAALSPTLFFAALDVLDAMDVMVMEGVDGEFLNLFGPVTGPLAARVVEARLAELPRQHWLDRLAAAGVPAEPVQTRAEWVASTAFATLGGHDTFHHPVVGEARTPATPLQFSVPGDGSASVGSGQGWLCRVVDAGRPGPLAGVRVVDLANFLAAPFAATLLGMWGADVVKVETPDGDPYRVYSIAYLAVNQGKRSVVLDLRGAEGRRSFEQLVAGADVLIDNLRPSSRTSLSMESETIRALNPQVVHATVTAFGEDGDWRERPGFDPSIQALSGLMAAVGEPGTPVSTTTAIHDVGSGALLAVGALAGLWRQARDGIAPRVMTSLAGTASLLQCAELTEFVGRPPPPTGGVDFVGGSAARRYYRAADGWIGVAVRSGDEASRVVALLGADVGDTLDEDPHGPTARALEAAISRRPVADALDLLGRAGVPAAPVVSGWATDEHLQANDISHVVRDPDFGRCRVMRGYGHWSRSGEAVPAAMPAKGADTAVFADGWPH